MADNKFDATKHAVLPVLHPNGEVHTIAVDQNTPLEDLHSALVDSGYAQSPIQFQQEQPKAEGSIEHSPQFRAAAKAAVGVGEPFVPTGQRNKEAGFIVYNSGKYSPTFSKQGNDMQFPVLTDSAFGTVHTHPYNRSGRPSKGDIEDAKKFKKNFYVISKEGLWLVEKDGKVSQIYSNADWINKK